MNASEFEARLARFQCQRCNQCCTKPGFVYLEKEEPKKIADYLGVDEFSFVNEHCEVVERTHIVLKKNADESCIFLDEKGCKIHPVKPRQCLDFPIKWRTPNSFNYCEGLKKIFPKGFQTDKNENRSL